MRPSLQTRKPIAHLQPEDFAAFPIWEFTTDEEEREEQDETWVRPVASNSIGLNRYSLSVAADFHTASGQAIAGFIGVTTAGAFEFGHGVLLHQGKYIFVPSAEYPQAENERKEIVAALGLCEAQVFPLEFSLRVLVEGESAVRHGEFA